MSHFWKSPQNVYPYEALVVFNASWMFYRQRTFLKISWEHAQTNSIQSGKKFISLAGLLVLTARKYCESHFDSFLLFIQAQRRKKRNIGAYISREILLSRPLGSYRNSAVIAKNKALQRKYVIYRFIPHCQVICQVSKYSRMVSMNLF